MERELDQSAKGKKGTKKQQQKKKKKAKKEDEDEKAAANDALTDELDKK